MARGSGRGRTEYFLSVAPAQHVRAGLLGLAFLFAPLSVAAQATYIDVEAERRAVAQRDPTAPATVYSTTSARPSTTLASPQQGDEPGQPGGADLGRLFMQIQRLQEEVMRLNGMLEEQAYELRTLKTQSLERYLDLDRRLGGSGVAGSGLGPSGALAGESPTGSGSGFAGATSAGSAAPPAATDAVEQPGEGDAYRAAFALVRGQEFDAAVVSFRQFLQRFPDGRYAPNAHYWMGELYLAVQPPDPEAARQSFMLLLDAYPDNAKVPDAMYKLGRVHLMKGNRERAREFLQRVISEYPDSEAAPLARDFLAQNLSAG
jgi:tol-pal system protein YbgF